MKKGIPRRLLIRKKRATKKVVNNRSLPILTTKELELTISLLGSTELRKE